MKRVLGASLLFAGALSALLGAVEAALGTGLVAGRERAAAIVALALSLGAAFACARLAASGGHRAASRAIAITSGLAIFATTLWALEVAIVRRLDPSDAAVAALLFAAGAALSAAGAWLSGPRGGRASTVTKS